MAISVRWKATGLGLSEDFYEVALFREDTIECAEFMKVEESMSLGH